MPFQMGGWLDVPTHIWDRCVVAIITRESGGAWILVAARDGTTTAGGRGNCSSSAQSRTPRANTRSAKVMGKASRNGAVARSGAQDRAQYPLETSTLNASMVGLGTSLPRLASWRARGHRWWRSPNVTPNKC